MQCQQCVQPCQSSALGMAGLFEGVVGQHRPGRAAQLGRGRGLQRQRLLRDGGGGFGLAQRKQLFGCPHQHGAIARVGREGGGEAQ